MTPWIAAPGRLPLWDQTPVSATSAHVVDPDGEHGEVATRPWVVEMILNLAAYSPSKDLALLTAIEPACGTGAFLGPLVKRLSASCKLYGRALSEAADAVRAFDLLPRNVAASRKLVETVLLEEGWSQAEVEAICTKWITVADYLLMPEQLDEADLVLGNPPYIRLEDVPHGRMQAYRRSCTTMTGRSDIYIGFFERALRSLKEGGRVAFICADRWMRNQYGRRLRALVAQSFSVDATIIMHDVDAFEAQVSAYPAISLLSRRQQTASLVVETNSRFGPDHARLIDGYFHSSATATVKNGAYEVSRLPHWFSGDTSWPTGSPSRLAMIEDLTDRFPPLEDPATRTKVGIGLASGADNVYITKDRNIVEPERLLPIALASDLRNGRVEWSGNYLVNPWDDHGVVDLKDYPRLRTYYDSNAVALRGRNVAARRPTHWYRTIDRVMPGLQTAQKLMIPDMRMQLQPVLDTGENYPHQSLYYLRSADWDLRVLGGLLLSRVANAFIEAFAVRMRGGTLRFQAQYLRRIRVPRIEDISERDADLLRLAFEEGNVDRATAVAQRLYRINLIPD